MSKPEGDAPRTVAAVDKTCKILEAIHTLEGAGVTEIAEATGGSKANVHKHLRTLQAAGFVREQDGEYHERHRQGESSDQ